MPRMASRRARLPSLLTSFVGRGADLERLRRLLGNGARLVTLFGPGGVGKTRLALRLAETYEGPTWFSDLSEAKTIEDACGVVRRELGQKIPAAGARAVDAIGRALAALGPGLFLLDNCEQIAAPLAEAMAGWCAEATALQFVATSRELFRVPCEHAYEVRPLEVPHDDADVARSEAVQLFVARAQATRHEYAPSATEASTIAAIVRRLDGLPLAIELAAARMGVLSAKDLLDRIDDRLALGSVRRGTPARQATLRSTIAWSWEMLAPWEQAAFAQCATFHGGFSLRAAEAVLDLGAWRGAPTTLDVVQSLREKSLVRAFVRPGAPDEVRFGLYDTVREFAEEQLLARDDREAALARHAAFHVAIGESWLAHGMRRNAPEELAVLALELDNLLAVVERALAATPPRARDALVAALAAETALSLRGDVPAAQRLLDRVLARVGDAPEDPALVSLALSARSRTQQWSGPAEQLRADLERAAELARAASDPLAEGRAIAGVGLLAAQTWDHARARELLERALALHRAADDAAAEVRALRTLGVMEYNAARRAEAVIHLERALQRARDAGDEEQIAFCLGDLGVVDIALGRLEAGIARIESARTLFLSFGEPPFYLGQSAFALQELGRWDEAEARYEEAIAALQRAGRAYSLAITLGYAATLVHERGDVARAEAAYARALASLANLPEAPGLLGFIRAGYGALLAAAGRVDEATRELDAAEAILAGQGEEWKAVVAVHRGHLDLALAAARDAACDPDAARQLRASAAARLVHQGTQGTPGEDLRFALRLLRRAVEGQAGAEGDGVRDELVVGPEARWFRLGKAPAVDLSRRRPLRHLLLALVQARLAGQGEPLTPEALVEAGWRGERMSAQAGLNRLHVALSELRTLGLREVIASRWGGYLLVPSVHVRWSDDPAPKTP